MLATLLCLMLLCASLNEKPIECAEYEEGTDMYYECVTGEELDLSPVIQDEAETLQSQRREP